MSKNREKATLALVDGKVWSGYSIGASGETAGEAVFNTSMTGYQEILTDPSYACQLLTFTYPHIGNVGVNSEDMESSKVQAAGVIVKELSEHYSNFRAEKSLQEFLIEEGVVGIGGIDTRDVVLHLRDNGAQMGVIATGEVSGDELVDKAKSLPGMAGRNLAKEVSTKEIYTWNEGVWKLGEGVRTYSDDELASRPHVVAIDFGIKRNMLRLFVDRGFRVTVVPASTSVEDILSLSPDGIFLSNGPGDPAPVVEGIETVKGLLNKAPIFGICLGHQIFGEALGAKTYKLKFGHRGGNHPVRNEFTGKVEITVQNHGFATDLEAVPGDVRVSHINLNDKTVEGFDIPDLKCFYLSVSS